MKVFTLMTLSPAEVATPNPQIRPIRITGQQVRSILRHLANNGRYAEVTTVHYHGRELPLFYGATAAQVIGAAHNISSLCGEPWLKVALAEIQHPGAATSFCSSLLEWEAAPRC